MTKKPSVYYETNTLTDFRKNPKMRAIISGEIEKMKSDVEAAFLQEFGFRGEFEIRVIETNGHWTGAWQAKTGGGTPRPRVAFRLHAANARTGAILKAHPGWLGRFAK